MDVAGVDRVVDNAILVKVIVADYHLDFEKLALPDLTSKIRI